MNQKTRTSYLLISVVILLLFALAACVRPVPQPDQPEGEATALPPTTAPTVELPTAVPSSPTPESGYPGEGEGDGQTTEPPAEPTAEPSQPEPTAAPSGEATTHTVQQGDTLYSISQQYGVSVDEITAANNLTNANALTPGQVLVIPAPGTVVTQPGGGAGQPAQPGEQVHVVQPGENLFRISLRYGKTVDEVAAYNGIANPHYIYPGQVIRIP